MSKKDTPSERQIAAYQRKVEVIKDRYVDRILATLNEWREVLNTAGYHFDEPNELTDEEFEWWMSSPPKREGVDIEFVIAESLCHEGSVDGVTFRVDINRYEGAIIGGLAPYNYTPDCWVNVNDAEAVEERLMLVLDADPNEIVELLAKHGVRPKE